MRILCINKFKTAHIKLQNLHYFLLCDIFQCALEKVIYFCLFDNGLNIIICETVRQLLKIVGIEKKLCIRGMVCYYY